MEKVTNFGEAVKQAGASTADKKGMWADSDFKDLLQYNDGFRTGLIGTTEQVAERIIEYRKVGIDLVRTGFLHVRETSSASARRSSRSCASSSRTSRRSCAPRTISSGLLGERWSADGEELRRLQRPLKEQYREQPGTALVTSAATATLAPDGIAATVDGSGVRAGLHPVAGGDGSEACSADLLLEALAACAGVTLRSVATALGVTVRSGTARATGTWHARGTLGVDRDVPVGITDVHLPFDLDTDADEATVQQLLEITERYCVIAQTLRTPPSLEVTAWRG